MDKTLLLVDMLNDFIDPSGKLYFPAGAGVVAAIVRLRAAFRAAGAPVVYANDAHPTDSAEFATWPPHCLMGSSGARLIDALAAGPGDIIFHKDALSLFAQPLAGNLLRGLGARQLYVVGVATEYCVREAVLDARGQGFDVTVVADAIAAVAPDDGERAMADMRAAGAVFAPFAAVLAEVGR